MNSELTDPTDENELLKDELEEANRTITDLKDEVNELNYLYNVETNCTNRMTDLWGDDPKNAEVTMPGWKVIPDFEVLVNWLCEKVENMYKDDNNGI